MTVSAHISSEPARARIPSSWWGPVAAATGIGGLALLGPFLAPYRPAALSGEPIEPFSRPHLLGTNLAGQDLASHLLHGARASILIAVIAALASVTVATIVGGCAGWFAGRVDRVISRCIDLVTVVPRLPLLILLGAYVGTSILAIASVIAAVSWPGPARVMRASVVVLRERGHVRAALGFGATRLSVARRHVLPAVAPLSAVFFATTASRAVVFESGLAFLGIGDVTRVSWGTTLREALEFGGLFRTDAWQWWLLPPVAALTALTLAFGAVAKPLERAANPRLRSGPARPRRGAGS